jgi:hypothetical protein
MIVLQVCRTVVAVVAVAAVGCSAKPAYERPKVVPVRGVVRYNGKPLDGAHVTFAHTTAGISASGVADAEGVFTLTTFEPGDGAVPGKYHVAVSKAEDPHRTGAKDAPPIFQRGAGGQHPRWLIPQRYSNLTTSKLTADVPEAGTNDIVLDLQGS